jgi:hypothetical protein
VLYLGVGSSSHPFCCSPLAEIAGSNPVHDHGCLSLLSAVFCQVEVSAASGLSLLQRTPTECDVSDCDSKASLIRKHWPTRADVPWEKKCILGNNFYFVVLYCVVFS